MSDSDTILQARVIAGLTVGCVSGVALIALAAVRYIRRRRAEGRIIVNEPGKDLELEAGDSVPQTPGEDDIGRATRKKDTRSPQPEAVAICKEAIQMVQQTPRTDVRVVYNPDDPSTHPPPISSRNMSQGTVPMQVMTGKPYRGLPEV